MSDVSGLRIDMDIMAQDLRYEIAQVRNDSNDEHYEVHNLKERVSQLEKDLENAVYRFEKSIYALEERVEQVIYTLTENKMTFPAGHRYRRNSDGTTGTA